MFDYFKIIFANVSLGTLILNNKINKRKLKKEQNEFLLQWTHDNLVISLTSRPVQTLKSNTGGVSCCWTGIENSTLYTQKYTPPHCFLCNFKTYSPWVVQDGCTIIRQVDKRPTKLIGISFEGQHQINSNFSMTLTWGRTFPFSAESVNKKRWAKYRSSPNIFVFS